ncbi:MAG: acetate/propionate family kinase [Leptothrix sp. (in: b-proteobacteria)]
MTSKTSAPETPEDAPDTLTPAVLVVNAGASQLKFALYPRRDSLGLSALVRGQIEGLLPGAAMRLVTADGMALPLTAGATVEVRLAAALKALQDLIASRAPQAQVVSVAHRVVHGGPHYRASVALDEAVVAMLSTLEPMAPLHQAHNLAGVRALRKAYPKLLQVACFDTSFHATLPKLEQRYALPTELHEQGMRRYGFHGLSYDHVIGELRNRSDRSLGRVLMVHLGSGASACAAVNGKSVATSMGFSALDGLVMGTRSGQIDPGIVLHLWRQGWSEAEVSKLLYQDSGLLGVSGISSDLRELRRAASAGHAASQTAIDLFDYRLKREAGGLCAVLGGIDLLAFTGGIGEHDAATRAAMAEGLAHLGVRLDLTANLAAKGDRIMPIHAHGSSAEIWVVPTDEGRVAADAAWELLDRQPAGRGSVAGK